jgi:thiol-disulfide isomerase/thioredoxin
MMPFIKRGDFFIMWSHNLTILLAAAMACCGAAQLPAQVTVGDATPDLAALQLEGELPPTAGKVILLDIWASWCAPCKAAFPALAQLQNEFGDQGFLVVAVSVDRRPRDYLAFVQRFQPPFVTVRDAAQALAANFRPPAMPSSYLIGRDGRVRSVHAGFHGTRTVDELRARIVALLKESP